MDIILERIETLRKERNVQQKDVCKAVGISNAVYTDWLAGRNKSYKKHAAAIADYFGVSADYLLGRTDDPAPQMWVVPNGSTDPVPFSDLTDDERDAIMAFLAAYRAQKAKKPR